jgi:hypothetical protein
LNANGSEIINKKVENIMEKKVLKFFNKYKIDPNGKDMTALEEKM